MPQATEAASKRRGKAKAPSLSRDEMLRAYRDMLLIRRFEEACAKAYSQGRIGGFLHLYIGQESVAVGACSLMGDDDHDPDDDNFDDNDANENELFKSSCV